MGEDSTRKVVVLLLILAIVFSAVSIFIGISALNLSAPQSEGAGQGGSSSAGSIVFVVETSKAEGGSGG